LCLRASKLFHGIVKTNAPVRVFKHLRFFKHSEHPAKSRAVKFVSYLPQEHDNMVHGSVKEDCLFSFTPTFIQH